MNSKGDLEQDGKALGVILVMATRLSPSMSAQVISEILEMR